MSAKPLWVLYVMGVNFHRNYTYTNGKAARDYWDGIIDSEIADHVHCMAMYYGNELKMVHVKVPGAFVMDQINNDDVNFGMGVDSDIPF